MAGASNFIASANCQDRSVANRDATASCSGRRQFKRPWPVCIHSHILNQRKQFKVKADPRIWSRGCETYHALRKVRLCKMDEQVAKMMAHFDDRIAIMMSYDDHETQNDYLDIKPHDISSLGSEIHSFSTTSKEACPTDEAHLRKGSPHSGMRSRRELLVGTVLSGLAMSVSFQTRKTLAAVAPIPEGAKQVSPDVVSSPSAEMPVGSRIYDASVLGEPFAVGKDKGRVWQKILAARVVYLGESERVPDPDDKVLELEIVRTIRDKCFEQQRPVSLALEAFPCTLQPQLNAYMSKRLSDKQLRELVPHWPDERWEEYKPLLQYCRNNGVRLMAGGTPLEVLRTVQAKGVQGLSDNDRRNYVPATGAGIGLNSTSMNQQLSLYDVLPNASTPFGPGPYRFAQARMVEDHTMSQVVLQGMADGGSVGILLVVVGATHVLFGSKGSGIPARISKNLQKRTQAVILLNPERQRIRKEGELPEADFLWYSAAKQCSRNCFDRAEIARVMDAAGRRRDALPKDLQTGLDLGLVPPEVLKDFFDLDKQPFIAELTKNFQGFRERWLADPRFLQRLGIEEAISITTTLIAQYERRKGRFFQELDYVITDTLRGAVVDFFTVWLPAPTLSFRSSDTQAHASGVLEGLKGLLGSVPDNAFQRATSVKWDLQARILAVLVGGVKLFSVGFIASIGTVAVTNTALGIKQRLNPQNAQKKQNKRSPVGKTALVYACFLGTSANLRYQAIAGLVEHWVADFYLASYPVAGNILSFVARTANSYWGTQQWIDLARLTGLQAHNETPPALVEQVTVSETVEHLPVRPETSADRFKAESNMWEVSAMERMAPTTIQEEHLDDDVENLNGPGK